MFEVLAYVYDSYWSGPQCPALPALHRKLNAVGFDADAILNALVWLEDLQSAAHTQAVATTGGHLDAGSGASLSPQESIRILTAAEHRKLGTPAWGLLSYLASVGSLRCDHMELVIDRAMASPSPTLALDDVKLIVLMVFWSLNEVPDPRLTDCWLGDGSAHPVH